MLDGLDERERELFARAEHLYHHPDRIRESDAEVLREVQEILERRGDFGRLMRFVREKRGRR